MQHAAKQSASQIRPASDTSVEDLTNTLERLNTNDSTTSPTPAVVSEPDFVIWKQDPVEAKTRSAGFKEYPKRIHIYIPSCANEDLLEEEKFEDETAYGWFLSDVEPLLEKLPDGSYAYLSIKGNVSEIWRHLVNSSHTLKKLPGNFVGFMITNRGGKFGLFLWFESLVAGNILLNSPHFRALKLLPFVEANKIQPDQPDIHVVSHEKKIQQSKGHKKRAR